VTRGQVTVRAVGGDGGQFWSLSSLELLLHLPCANLALEAELYPAACAATASTPVGGSLFAGHDAGFGRGLQHPSVVGDFLGHETDDGRVQIVDWGSATGVVAPRPGRRGSPGAESTSTSRRGRSCRLDGERHIVEAPQVFVFSLVALEVPGVVVECVVTHALVVCSVDAASVLAGKGALGAGAGNASRRVCVCGVCSSAAAGGGDGPHANLLIPVRVGAGGLGVVVAVGLFEDELLTGLAGEAGVSAAASAVVVAGAGCARGVVEDGALDSA
jgi:hypothetical protein